MVRGATSARICGAALRPMRAVRIPGPLLCLATLVALAVWSWGKWPDVQIDFGRELYVAWRLAEGEVLYRDLAYFNGPLSPYFNALLFAVFGSRFWVLSWANLGLLALTGWLLYRLLRHGTDRVGATAAVMALFGVFAFGHVMSVGNYNWISPYSHELTHGVILSVAVDVAGGARRAPGIGGVAGGRWAGPGVGAADESRGGDRRRRRCRVHRGPHRSGSQSPHRLHPGRQRAGGAVAGLGAARHCALAGRRAGGRARLVAGGGLGGDRRAHLLPARHGGSTT